MFKQTSKKLKLLIFRIGFYNDMIAMLGADKNNPKGKSFPLPTINQSGLGIASLKSRSPLFFADRVKKPLLIIHGKRMFIANF